jgi:hypothetical protein
VAYFQRLTARDQDEASRIVHEQVAAHDAAEVYDATITKALILAAEAAGEGDLEAGTETYIYETTEEILEELESDRPHTSDEPPASIPTRSPVRLLTCPARGKGDEVTLRMLTSLLDSEKWEVVFSATELLTSELIARVQKINPVVVCVGSLPPGGLAHTRYLCKRLRGLSPSLRIVVGRWGQQEDMEQAKKELLRAGADDVFFTFEEGRQQLESWLPVFQARRTDDDAEVQEGQETLASESLVGTAPAQS